MLYSKLVTASLYLWPRKFHEMAFFISMCNSIHIEFTMSRQSIICILHCIWNVTVEQSLKLWILSQIFGGHFTHHQSLVIHPADDLSVGYFAFPHVFGESVSAFISELICSIVTRIVRKIPKLDAPSTMNNFPLFLNFRRGSK